MAGDARRQLDLVPVLAGIDAKILTQLIAAVLDTKFNLFRVARGNPYASIIGFHAHIGVPRHGKRLGDFFSAGSDRASQQHARASNSQPKGGRAVGKQVHVQYPP
jgi:hypothetical protein